MKRLLLVLAACKSTSASDPTSLAQLFSGTKAPTLAVAPLSAVDWKMPFASAEQTLRKHDTDGLRYGTVGDIAGKLQEVAIQATDLTAAPLIALWGEPAAITARDNTLVPADAKVWYGDHVLAALGPKAFLLVHYVPLAEELGDPANPLLGFERGGQQIFGSTRAQLEERYQDMLQQRGPMTVIQLPADELDSSLLIHIGYDDKSQLATSMQFYVHAAPGRRELLAKRFGATAIPLDRPVTTVKWHDREVDIVAGEDPLWSIALTKP